MLWLLDKLKIKKINKTCSKCGSKLGVGDIFCPRCGKRFEESIICPHCKASVAIDSSFCTKCGKSLNQDSTNEEFDFSQQFDFYAREITSNGDLKGEIQINKKKYEGIIVRKVIENFGWDIYQKVGVPIRCTFFKSAKGKPITQLNNGNTVYLLHVEKKSNHKKETYIPVGSFTFTATDVSNKNALLGRVIVNGKEYKGSIQNSDLPAEINVNDLVGKTFSVEIKSPLQDKVEGEPYYPLLIKDSFSIIKDDSLNNNSKKFIPDNSVSCEEKIQRALKSLEQEGCEYFNDVNLNQSKNVEDVIQSLPSENRDYALRIYNKIKHAIFDLKENRDGVNIKNLIDSVKKDGLTYLEKEKQLNTFLAAIFFEINDVEQLKEYLKKEMYNNFGFYFANSIQEEDLKIEFAKKHLIIDHYLPHMDRNVIFVAVCELLRKNDYSFLKEIEKINDKESYSSILKFLLKANSLSYDSTVGLSKSEEFRYLYRIACEIFLDDYQIEKKKIIFNSELSSETYPFTSDDISQSGALLGKVNVDGTLYKGSIQKSDLPQGKPAWQLIGSTFYVFLKGDLQTGQPGGDYYKLFPKERHIVNKSTQAFPLYTKAHDLKFKINNPAEAKDFYIKSINDEREKQKRVSSVPDLVSIFIQEGNYTDAISYLTKYKTEIRPQAYDSFMNTIAIKQGHKSDYIPTTSTEFPLYDLAHQTLFDFRQRDEAIVQYREAINAGQNVGASVAELITVLIQIQNFDESADLLAQYGKDMKPTAYENLKKQVLSFRPELDAKISGKKKINQKSNLKMASEACDNKDFDKAIMYYEAAIRDKENLNQAVPELIQLYLKFGLDSMAESIYTDYQKELEIGNHQHILQGFYEYYSKLNNEIKKEEIEQIYYSIFDETIHEKEQIEINNSELEYSDKNLDYFKEMIISYKLPENLKGSYLDSAAIDLHEKYDNYLFKCSEEDLLVNKGRIGTYLPEDKTIVWLKMIKGFINSKEKPLSNKDTKMYVNALVNLIMYFGDNPIY